MWLRSGSFIGPAAASGLKPHPALSLLRPADLPFFVSAFSLSHLASPSLKNTPQDHPNAGNETPGPQIENAGRARLVRGRERGRKCQHHAQAGADVRHPQATRDPGNRHYRRRRRRGSLRRLRLSSFAGRQLPARPRRHLRLAVADPPLRSPHRRHHRRPHSQPQGRRTLLRAAQGQHPQFRGSGKVQAQGQFRQPHAAVSGPALSPRTRRPDAQRPFCKGDRHRRSRSAKASAR